MKISGRTYIYIYPHSYLTPSATCPHSEHGFDQPKSHNARAGQECKSERESVFRQPPNQLKFASTRIEIANVEQGLRARAQIILKFFYVTKDPTLTLTFAILSLIY